MAADVSTFSYVALENPHPGSGVLIGFPLEGKRVHFHTELTYVLGSTNPCPTAVHMEYLGRQY